MLPATAGPHSAHTSERRESEEAPMSVTQDLHPDTGHRARRAAMTLRHVHHHLHSTTDQHPDGPRFLPVGEYLDPEIHAAERRLFRTVPLVAAHSSALPGAHSFTAEEVAGVPVLLIRQKD